MSDDDHVAVVVVDPGPFPKQFAKSVEMLRQEVPQFTELPAVLVANIDRSTAKSWLEFVGRGGVTLGITDAAVAAALFGEPEASPDPSVDPSIAPSAAPDGA